LLKITALFTLDNQVKSPISSFDSTSILVHLVTFNGPYIGIKTLTLGSGLFCSMKLLFTGSLIVCLRDN